MRPASPCDLWERFKEQCRRSFGPGDDVPLAPELAADLAPTEGSSSVGDQADIFGRTIQLAAPLPVQGVPEVRETGLGDVVRAIGRPVRARGLTTWRRTVVSSTQIEAVQFLPGNPGRRAFTVQPTENEFVIHWDPIVFTGAQVGGFRIVVQQTPIYVFTEEDWGVAIQYPWFYWNAGQNLAVYAFEEVYL